MHETQQQSRTASGSWRGGYAEWIAVGALVAGSVGALIGAKHCSRRGHRTDGAPPSGFIDADRAARRQARGGAPVTATHGGTEAVSLPGSVPHCLGVS